MVTGLFTCVFMISVLNVIFKLVLLNLKKKKVRVSFIAIYRNFAFFILN